MKIIKKIINLLKILISYENRFTNIELALGRIENRQCENIDTNLINDYEFKVSSQWGEDGIIQYLINKIGISNKIFIEFGVQNYTESNTRFLLANNNWSGLVIDGSQEHINYIKNDLIYWKYNIKAECAFIDKDNINDLITNNGISKDIGLLSVDIDGNDYWVWESMDCVQPNIVICEYNAIFGDKEKVSIPYKADFYRTDAHYSNLYWGASLPALEYLAKKKGYTLVGTNKAGNNAFFILNDSLEKSGIKGKTAEEAYRYSFFRESRDKDGNLTYLSKEEAFSVLSECELERVDTNERVLFKKVYGLV